MSTHQVTYKGETFEYDLFHEVFDFVAEVDNLDVVTDHALIERRAQRLDDLAIRLDFTVINSPSGWSYIAEQENGDNVDCRDCGDPLNDDHPIHNDAAGYAYHAGCL